MMKKKSNPWARAKYLYVLPLATVAIAAFAHPEVSNEANEISSVKVNDLASIVKTKGTENADSTSKKQCFEAIANAKEGEKPLIVIDGKAFGSLSLDDIDVSKIKSMSVLKGEEARKLFGEKAKNGVVLITSERPEETKVIENVAFSKTEISGIIIEQPSMKPVSGANIVIQGTSHSTMSDANGNFKIKAEEGDVLVISYPGLKTQYATVKLGVRHGIHMPIEGYNPSKEELVYMVVEEMPEYPGGMAECMKFLSENVKYPASAHEANIQGRVIVKFTVQKDGTLTDVQIVRGVNPELDAEAIRVVKMMPKWKPGKQKGKSVNVNFTIPITFSLQ